MPSFRRRYEQEGGAIRPVDAFDDQAVEQEYIGRGATVYNGTLLPGDTIYIPTGVMHAGMNVAEAEPTIAFTANFLDGHHSPQIMSEFCAFFFLVHGFFMLHPTIPTGMHLLLIKNG